MVNIATKRSSVEKRRAAPSYAAIERRLEDLERETQASLAATTSGWTRSSRLYVNSSRHRREPSTGLGSPDPKTRRKRGLRAQLGGVALASEMLAASREQVFTGGEAGSRVLTSLSPAAK